MDARDTNTAPLPPEEYGAEVLCASWNPAASAVEEPRAPVHRTPDLSAGEAESFLSQFYRCQEI